MSMAPIEITQKEFDVHDLTKAVRFYFQNFELNGINFSVIDGNKDNPYVVSTNGRNIKMIHILIMMDYCVKNLSKFSKDNSKIDYPSKKAISDLADATKYLLDANGIKIGEKTTMEE